MMSLLQTLTSRAPCHAPNAALHYKPVTTVVAVGGWRRATTIPVAVIAPATSKTRYGGVGQGKRETRLNLSLIHI